MTLEYAQHRGKFVVYYDLAVELPATTIANLWLQVRRMAKQKSEPDADHRRAPDIPGDLTPLADLEEIIAEGPSGILERSIEGLSLASLPATVLRFESCVLTRVSFADSVLPGLRFKDVRLVDCNFSNTEARGFGAVRTEFKTCRLTGLRASEAVWQHVTECDGRYAQLRFGTFGATEFSNCKFGEADFHGTNFGGCRFRSCDLHSVELSGATMAGADLRGSNVEGLRANPENLRGATVDASQAMSFAAIFGLRIA
jgi:uncharacterized protein YjbI with pentapeptide repeats